MIPDLLKHLGTRPAISGERKQFGLGRATKRVPKQEVLSEVAIVAIQEESLKWTISSSPFLFSEEFVHLVGMELPMGVGPHRQALIAVLNRYGMAEWEIVACYLDFSYPHLLWRQKQKPEWLLRGVGGAKTEET